jgi:aryl-alcohol dehydrogenase-like predicted oxidoreductase
MEYRRLGNSGLKISLAGLGCNNFGMRIDAEQTRAVVHRALDEGITFFDTADIYGNRGQSEEMLGKALGVRRREIVVASKFGMTMADGPYGHGASRRHIVASCEGSLKRLDTDYIDLYQVHTPDSETPEEETLAALDDLVRSGKVRYIGCSNYSGWRLADSCWISRTRGQAAYISAQNHYNLLERSIEAELIPACVHFGVGILPYFPLASGFLTGKYRPNAAPPPDTRFATIKRLAAGVLKDDNFAKLAALEKFAEEHHHSMIELAVSWLAAQPMVASVICGATRHEQVTENARAGDWKLTAAQLAAIDKIVK